MSPGIGTLLHSEIACGRQKRVSKAKPGHSREICCFSSQHRLDRLLIVPLLKTQYVYHTAFTLSTVIEAFGKHVTVFLYFAVILQLCFVNSVPARNDFQSFSG